MILNSRALSCTTPFEIDFVKGSYKALSGVTISGIASGLEATGVRTMLYKFKNDDNNFIDLYVDHVLHLKKLLSRLISRQ